MTEMTVFDDRVCTLGEGALWHPLRGQLFWFDILAGRLMSRRGDEALSWELGEMASAAGWIDEETLLIATETALRRFDLATGTAEEVHSLEAENDATRSNDGRTDPLGGFWIGTMGKRAEEGAGAIYRFHRGALRRLWDAYTTPNTICFAPDGRTAYHTDTPRGRVLAHPLDDDGWPAHEPRVLIDFSGEGLNPDGAVTDAEGNLWIAQWGASRVACHAPDGTFHRAVRVPAQQPSCPAFGGPNLDCLFVTTAREGMDEDMLRLAPANGRTFALDGVARGRAEPQVILG